MDYEKKYNEALERAKAYHRNELSGTRKEITEYIFPELRESEDERISDTIFSCLHQCCNAEFISEKQRDDALAWLDKQKINTEGDFARGYDCGYECCLNSHGAEWFEKQKENPKTADSIPADCASNAKCEDRSLKHSDSFGTDIRDTPAYWRGWDDAMKQKEQKSAWSEENEKIMDTIVSVLGQYIDYKAVSGTGSGYATPRYSKEIDWLKSLRPSWKPSEEQMAWLKLAIDEAKEPLKSQLEELYKNIRENLIWK